MAYVFPKKGKPVVMPSKAMEKEMPNKVEMSKGKKMLEDSGCKMNMNGKAC